MHNHGVILEFAYFVQLASTPFKSNLTTRQILAKSSALAIQNLAARLIFCDHVTPCLLQLHWLPVRWRVQFKLQTLLCIASGVTSGIATAAENALFMSACVFTHRVSVCLSVRPSVTSRCSTKTAKSRITQTAPYDSPCRDSSFLTPTVVGGQRPISPEIRV